MIDIQGLLKTIQSSILKNRRTLTDYFWFTKSTTFFFTDLESSVGSTPLSASNRQWLNFQIYLHKIILFDSFLQQMRLVENGSTLKRWANVAVPIYFSAFMFNITNPEEFANGEKPQVQEIGPYVYLQKRRKLITHIDRDVVRILGYITNTLFMCRNQ